MRRAASWLLAAVLAAGCHSTVDSLDDAQSSLESNMNRYERICDSGNNASPGCLAYGKSINDLVDALADAEKAQGETFPKDAVRRVTDAKSAMEAAGKKAP